jgi:nicotinate-nucleotide adenylyltransferase
MAAHPRRIGIFGGTFDPVHVGHLRCAEEARELLGLERIIFIPSANPPHKRHQPVAAAAQRLAMVRLAISGNPGFRVSSIELDRPGHTYTVDTLRALRTRARDARFVFLIGVDAFREIHTWKDYRTLFTLTDFAILARPPHRVTSLRRLLPVATRRNFCYGPDQLTVLHRSGNRISLLNSTALDLSASSIRQRARRGQSIRYLVVPSAERYIAHHGLYQRGSTPA